MSIKETIYSLLTTDTALQGLLGATVSNKKVFYHRSISPIKENIPCVTFDWQEVPEVPNLLHKTSVDGVLTLDIWSNTSNMDDIFNRIKALFKAAKKPLECDLTLAYDFKDEDKTIYRKHITYEIKGG